jgi:dienelactone hydrolase
LRLAVSVLQVGIHIDCVPFVVLQPSEYNTYYDIEAVYDCLKKEYGIEEEDLILYGQSVGSGPTLHLASRLEKLRGVVLHSGILSGIRVLYPVKVTLWFDIFKASLDHNLIITLPFCSRTVFDLSS